MELPGVQSMVKWLSSGEVLDGETRLFDLRYLDDFHFTRLELAKHKDPYVVVGELDYKPDTIPTTIPYWKAVVEAGRNEEPGTLSYGICKDPKDKDKLYCLEVYESKDYLMDVHAKSQAIQESIKNTKHLRNGLRHHWLKLSGGFLVKGTEQS
jgi:quinol monooxygenase YgiN